jgi:hypothetical protein
VSTKPNSSNNPSGTSLAIVSAFQTQALGRRPVTAMAESVAAHTTTQAARPPGSGKLAASWAATPAKTAAVLISAETPATQPTIQPTLAPNAVRAQT